MLKDFRIRKKINKVMTPKKSFEEFCHEQNLSIERTATKGSGRKFWFTLIPAAVIIMVLCVSIPVLNMFGNNSLPNPGTIYYGENDVANYRITEEELFEQQNIFLFDFTGVEQYTIINKISPIGQPELILGYSLQDVLYGFYIDDKLFAFEFDYLIRCYPGYKFTDNDSFNDLQYEFLHDNITYQYSIVENTINSCAYIFFEKQQIEYFLTLEAFEDITEINKSNIESFIENVL